MHLLTIKYFIAEVSGGSRLPLNLFGAVSLTHTPKIHLSLSLGYLVSTCGWRPPAAVEGRVNHDSSSALLGYSFPAVI